MIAMFKKFKPEIIAVATGLACGLLVLLCVMTKARAQTPVITGNEFPTQQQGKVVPGFVPMCIDPTSSKAAPCPGGGGGTGGTVNASATQIQGNGGGTTGAVVGTLAAAAGKTTYLCDFDVSAIGGTAPVGPITVAGLLGGSKVYQMSSSAGGVLLSRNFSPCLPASAANTAITITTTANGTATAVDVNSSGFRQ